MNEVRGTGYGARQILSDFDEDQNSCSSLCVTRLSLTSFRNYGDVRLDLDAAPVVLTGPNGSGKTNILEALSLLVPGRGLRRAALVDLQNKNSAEPWAVVADVVQGSGHGMRIGTGKDPESANGAKRVVLVDGKPLKSQQALADYVTIAWVTPDMDRLLADGPSERRKLLDRLVYSFDQAHAGRVHRYEKALRERLYLLREGMADTAWLDALEDTLAQTGVAIAAARLQLLRQLQAAVEETAGAFPRADLTLRGFAEEALRDKPALIVEDLLRQALAAARGQDALNGTSSVGSHRSDLVVVHRDKQCTAGLCSTGEQKALVIAIMLSYVRILMQAHERAPLFLLDDITAHLDERRRLALFEEIEDLGVQAWLTGTDELFFHDLKGRAQFLRVENGNIGAS